MDWDVRLIFIGLWSYVDDNGVGRDDERLVMAALFPLEQDPRETLARVSRALARLADGGQIVRYSVDGRRYLHVCAWNKHQRIDRPTKARYPLPTSDDAGTRDTLASHSRATREDASIFRPPEKGRRGEGEKGRRGDSAPAARRATRAHALPDDWQPTDTHKTYAEAERIDIDHEVAKFRDHAKANGRTLKDWNAAFSNWLRTDWVKRLPPSERPEIPSWAING